MGLFSKKEKPKCPICGKPITFLGGLVVKDGTICEDCEKMVRGQFDVEEYWQRKWGTNGFHREDYKLKVSDPLQGMCIADIQEMINEKKADQALILEEVGSRYANIAKVEEWFDIAPGPFDVGIKRAKELKNKIVCVSLVAAGEFARGDEVTVTTASGPVQTKLLDVIPITGAVPFDTELKSNIGKHKIGAGASAWIIVDMTDGVDVGSLIEK